MATSSLEDPRPGAGVAANFHSATVVGPFAVNCAFCDLTVLRYSCTGLGQQQRRGIRRCWRGGVFGCSVFFNAPIVGRGSACNI